MTPYEMASVAVKALDAKHGKEIRMLKTTDVTTLADYFVICTGTSNTQIKALTEFVEEEMKNAGEMADHIEGHREGTWVLSDYGCLVVHIFSPEAREFYDLERLWSDAENVDISDLISAD